MKPLGLSGALLPVRSVGVKADLRSYEQPVMLWGDLPWDLAEAVGAGNRCGAESVSCVGLPDRRALRRREREVGS